MYTKWLLIFFIFVSHAQAAKVVTTLPEFAWVVKKLAPKLDVESLLEGTEDPHFVDATPSFIFRAAKADMLIFNGIQLELGWLPKVLQMSGNEKIQVGSRGYCNAGLNITKIGVVKNYNRSMGDIHPQGNPHYSLSIPRMIEAVDRIYNCLKSGELSDYVDQKRLVLLKSLMQKKYVEIKKKTQPKLFYVYHRQFNYLAGDYGYILKQSLEKVPGVLPSANYLTTIAGKVKLDRPVKVLASNIAPEKILIKFKEMTGVDYSMLRLHPKRNQDYLEFIDDFLTKLNKF